MGNNHISFEDDCLRGKYAREIKKYFEDNNIKNWYVSPSSKKAEILIHPIGGLPENERKISRISLQVKDGEISFGLSGYNYVIIQDKKNICESNGYSYNKKEYNKYGKKENGRWWLTKPLKNIESVAVEFKNIEPLLD